MNALFQEAPLVAWIVVGIGLATAYYYYSVWTRSRDDIGFRIRRALVFVFVYALVIAVMRDQRQPAGISLVVAASVGFAAPLLLVSPPKRTRRISARVKRAVIERDLKGNPFNSRTHHIDHIVPYSKGGDNSVENLRVVSKEENLRRGNKMPRLRDFI